MADVRTKKILTFIELMLTSFSPKVKGTTLMYAIFYGITCLLTFAVAVFAMIYHMFYGMQKALEISKAL